MRHRLRQSVGAFALCLALAVAGCSSKSAAPVSAADVHSAEDHSAAADSAAPAAQAAVAKEPQRAFVEGYNAWRRRDMRFAADSLKYAAEHYPQLADYALYYRGSAQRELGEREEAAATMRRLAASYPQSVFAERAELAVAEIELDLGRPSEASALAARLVGRTADPAVEQGARIALARALVASNDPRGAYEQAEIVRRKYPHGAADSQARSLERELLAAHPEIVDVETVQYHLGEAELLLKEGLASEALAQVDAALALAPPRATRAELLWIEARASRGNRERAERALSDYLAIAPAGPSAPSALDMLAHLRWNQDDTAGARARFNRLVRQFPASKLAPPAMLSIGRTFEDDGDHEQARAEYQSLYARYPSSEPAAEARFRDAFLIYMAGDYPAAARRFAAMSERVSDGAERDRFTYWRARALEKNGEVEHARPIFESLALSIETNYYPALASGRTGLHPPIVPAASASDPAIGAPPALDGEAGFHLSRAIALRTLGLKQLEPAELKELEDFTGNVPSLRGFVLAGYQEAGAWYQALEAATQMAARGEIGREVAERVRYPRAYWDMVVSVAARERLDPYLMLSLTRQESLFNPQARSSSDARGLMQLMPATAHRIAASPGAGQLDLYDPAINVELGASYLRQLLDQFSGNRFKAVAAYNGGEHAVERWNAKFPGDDDQWVENIGYRETRDYVKKVIGGLREYQLLYQSRPGASHA
jgi:peptidoglycan lytic transglycosylase